MDGAWALYEAWVLLQEGEIDAALVYSFGRSSLGDLNEILALQLDPYYLAPAVARPGQPGRPAGPGRSSTRARAPKRSSPPSPPAAGRTPWPTPRPRWPTTVPVEKLLEDDYVVSPLRRHALPPITDGAAAIVLAAGDKATRWSKQPGVDHRLRPPDGDPLAGARDLTPSPSTARAGEVAGVAEGRSTWPSCTPRSPIRRSSSARRSA